MRRILFIALLGMMTVSCSKFTKINTTAKNCDVQTIISSELYSSAPADQLDVNSIEIIGDCLKINFSASGCNGESWELKLIDSEVVMKSNPPQRNLRLSLKDTEECEAYITKTVFYDISNLQLDGGKVKLNLTNSDKSVWYTY